MPIGARAQLLGLWRAVVLGAAAPVRKRVKGEVKNSRQRMALPSKLFIDKRNVHDRAANIHTQQLCTHTTLALPPSQSDPTLPPLA